MKIWWYTLEAEKRNKNIVKVECGDFAIFPMRRTQDDYEIIINGTRTGSKALFFSSQNNEEYITQVDEEELELNGPFNKVMLSQNEEEFITQDEQELQTTALGAEI